MESTLFASFEWAELNTVVFVNIGNRGMRGKQGVAVNQLLPYSRPSTLTPPLVTNSASLTVTTCGNIKDID